VIDTVFLTTDQVVTLALDRWGAHVRDPGIVDGAVMACRRSFDGYEPFPTLWHKADTLLRSLASTQGFVDGNKRTAWTATETFLALNGVFLEVSEVSATVYVLGVAVDVVESDLSIEWLRDQVV
jgi:death-on-curing protein